MKTPTISKTQKKLTLSGKKTRTKETIKNAVAAPYENSYWPQISQEDNETLEVILKNNLPRIKPNKVNVPWRVLKNIPKLDRKKFRENYTKSDELQINKKDSEGLTIGINSITQLLENNSVSAIIISSDVQPRIIVQHIIDQAVLYRVPLIVFEGLRTLLFKTCGVSSAAVCINKDVSPESKLNIIKESIAQIFEKYPPPVNHINYKRSLQHSAVDLTENTEVEKMDQPETTIDSSDDELESKIYLKRDDNRKRVFVPENTEDDVNVPKMEVDSTGFLSFSTASTTGNDKQVVKSNYKSLVVKRLKGDPGRIKRKITSLKKKKKEK